MMYLRRGGGYYFNVGCSDLIIADKVHLLQFADIDRFVADGAQLKDGSLVAADLLVLPGVGAASDTMNSLARLGLVEPIRRYVASGRPFFGVCLGLQVLLDGTNSNTATLVGAYATGVINSYSNDVLRYQDAAEPDDGIAAIGSGGPYAHAAARALLEHTALSAADIVKASLVIAGDLCIYTNQNHVIEVLEKGDG